MLKNTFNKLLNKYFAISVEAPQLANLERDVMKRIQLLKSENAERWYEKTVSALCVPQFQFASITLALFIGVMVSAIDNSQRAEASFMGDFSYDESHLSAKLNNYLG